MIGRGRAGTPTRRQFLAGCAGLASAAALGGCSAGSGATPPNTLNVWGGVPPGSGPAALIDAFTAAHPGTEVAYTRFVNDDRGNLKLDTALQGGVDIDVYFTYQTKALALRAESGMTLDITDRLADEPELAPFLDRDNPTAYWDGDRVRALATAAEPWFVLFNEAARERAGIPLPTRWTVQEFEEITREIRADGMFGTYEVPDSARIALGPDYWYTPDGGSNFSDPHFLEWLELGQRMIRDRVAYPWTEVLARNLDAYQHTAFVSGEFATWVNAPYSLRYLYNEKDYPHDFRVAAAPLPTAADGTGWNQGQFNNFIMINPQSPRQDLAWEFVRFWVTEGSKHMAVGGKIPTLGNVPQEEMLTSLLGPDPDRWFDVGSFRRVLFEERPHLYVDSDLTALPEITLAVEQQQDLCWIGERSPADSIASIDAQAAAAIDRYRKAA
ncbi:carbohydrate ABC transporter substrate-binding protein (CUT1 family) [Pseudonocardia hierapolitana]|uniref:Carbohydrate ABC transporter substrate-binding protein (CUT1 family) n=1 Tax=Pseudonocardia hierapolitana TaxID=1128676 RepID=A0A561SUI1_9PSEU|nr:extracellular solute-binding protein [Pseudonocardia hierapolitana]TWF78528.1 carbohydrate ABC transporter substrate-binding protein (CUT1 family) [Pseudonocardia hierapolitana]